MSLERFSDFDLDERLLMALKSLNFEKPTLIQTKTIQLALEGKDILAKAPTGTGKTAAYTLPVLNKILQQQKNKYQVSLDKSVKALIFVPTKELALQVYQFMQSLLKFIQNQIYLLNLVTDLSTQNQTLLLKENPDIVITTPSRLLGLLASSGVSLNQVQTLVLDEADLLLSFGYEKDIQQLMELHVPKICQKMLLSATLSDDLVSLKTSILRAPVTIKLEESGEQAAQLSQFSIQCQEEDKFLILYFILKLKLLKGKCLIFVNSLETGYKLKLFLDQFYIKCSVLNSEMPQNSRMHIIEEFNRNVFQYLIATDDINTKASNDNSEDGKEENENSKDSEKKKQKKKSKKLDVEFGVARGIDFKEVAVVINFDFPRTSSSYTHRVGRTARGMASGTALSFVTSADKKPFQRVEYKQKKKENEIKPYQFDLEKIEGFRYRVYDALRSITKKALKEARAKELKKEILNSEKLKNYLTEHPSDLTVLRHDQHLNAVRQKPELKHIPDYLMPGKRKLEPLNASNIPFHKPNKKRKFDQQKKKKSNTNPLKALIQSKK